MATDESSLRPHGQDSGPVAIVTGGSSGIGEATSRLLVQRGYRVVVASRDAEQVARVAAELPGAVGHAVDVSDSAAVDSLFERVMQRFGQLDAVVACAGVDDPETKAVLGVQMAEGGRILRTPDITDEAWHRQIATNLDGTFFTVRAAVRAMLPTGAGAIVTVSSGAAFDPTPGYSNYAASKAGVVALTQSIGKEMIGHGIRVNGVAPGLVNTPMLARAPSGLKGPPSGHPHRYQAQPEDIAAVIGFLISPDAVNLAGEVINANGGRLTD